MRISSTLREFVEVRARGRCEYCLIQQGDAWAVHELDHIQSLKHGGQSVQANLAFACGVCNRHKGSDLGSLAENDMFFRFFNPRRDRWDEHFAIRGARIEPLTLTGEVTARILQFNEKNRLAERAVLQRRGRYPVGDTRGT